MIKNKIKELSEKFLPEIINIRRHLHANPELSFEEYNTSRFVASKLKEFGITFRDGIVKTGIVGMITGTRTSSPVERTCVALRADMDALPITEMNEVEYKSKKNGVMHACGHDVHTASLLGAAKILNELKNEFSGTVKFIFQPGEEKAPGGASLMVEEGVLQDPKPSSIFAQHVFSPLEAGKVGFRSGKYMASTDEIYLTVKGKGGHAAMKGTYINPLLIASEILIELEKQFCNPPFSLGESSGIGQGGTPTVLAFGRMQANGATNVIPDEVRIEGTLRTLDEAWRKEAKIILQRLAVSKAKSMGGNCDVNILSGYPALINDEHTTLKAKKYAEEFLGAENVTELELRMTGEDFSYFAQKTPACFYRLGTGNVKMGITSGVHTPTFNVDESSMKTGMGLMAWIAINELAIVSKK